MKLFHVQAVIVYTPQVIAATGELDASRALKEAADVITESPAALQLRYLQTLCTVAAERNSTILFPVPIDIMTFFMKKEPKKELVKQQSIDSQTD